MNEDIILNAPVTSLQQMLRTISFVTEGYPSLIPDGIYGASTEEAVRTFQRNFNLPVTGRVDYTTFLAIVEVYDDAIEQLNILNGPIQRFPISLSIRPGQSHPVVFVVQGMLGALHETYPEIKKPVLTGTIDAVTADDIRLIQTLSGIPVTGAINSQTYQRIMQLYRIAFDDAILPTNG